jgi:hypothetical protein
MLVQCATVRVESTTEEMDGREGPPSPKGDASPRGRRRREQRGKWRQAESVELSPEVECLQNLLAGGVEEEEHGLLSGGFFLFHLILIVSKLSRSSSKVHKVACSL